MYSVSRTGQKKAVNKTVTARESEQRTRDRVLGAVLEHGPVSAAELGELLGFTPAAVRRHLDALSGTGLIQVKRVGGTSSGAGRPARRYVLSPQGQAYLGNDYLDIAVEALRQLGDALGPEAVARFAADRFEAMEEKYRPVVEAAGPAVEDRAEALAAELTKDGFVGSTTMIGTARTPSTLLSVQLCQGHCPIQALASSYPVFCDKETEVFSRLLGVDVRRLSTLSRGGHVCTTHIPVGRTRTAPAAPAPVEAITASSTHQQERP
ncbi:Helix-turn-helix domain protein [Arthrobacter saudimassiliensis]|uniref:Helix-turn-helix domain protein n=1 Tax=Arthrobacter saudimassiliensis TaxID=1461584 RepID=A0A078ML96_9MICC|nr:Helix-turn-helix domain protein [Arthrobacter saudimassiliensis]